MSNLKLNRKGIPWDLLAAKLDGEITREEEKRVQEWLEASEKHVILFEELKKIRKQIPQRKYDIEKAWNRVDQLTLRSGKKLWYSLFKYAAAILLPLIGIAMYWLVADINLFENNWGDNVQTGKESVHLILSDGSKYELGKEQTLSVKEAKKVLSIVDSNKCLKYKSLEKCSKTLRYNTLVVPTGGEYRLVLADGSKVWLNSQSELKYPVNFGKNNRTVYLKGEAYFKIEKDNLRPFLVHSDHVNIKVFGTEFNVCDYQEDGKVETTLVEGIVEVVHPNHEAVKLKPGEQAKLVVGGVVQVQKVEPRYYTSWKDGLFLFQNTPLEEITRKMERWYDVSIFFQNESVKNNRFSGAIEREKPIEYFLTLIEMTSGVRMEKKGRAVVVAEVS